MKYFELGKTGLQVSNLAMGCMRINGKTKEEVAKLIEAAVEEGINFFDHADISRIVAMSFCEPRS